MGKSEFKFGRTPWQAAVTIAFKACSPPPGVTDKVGLEEKYATYVNKLLMNLGVPEDALRALEALISSDVFKSFEEQFGKGLSVLLIRAACISSLIHSKIKRYYHEKIKPVEKSNPEEAIRRLIDLAREVGEAMASAAQQIGVNINVDEFVNEILKRVELKKKEEEQVTAPAGAYLPAEQVA